MRIDVITLFPAMFNAVSEYGVVGRAVQNNILNIYLWNPRDFSKDRHRRVDDRPYGGGPGMVMMAPPLREAIVAAQSDDERLRPVIYLSPQGRPINQSMLFDMSQWAGAILLAGRYEGIDERIISDYVDEEWSIGDYVLSGGELAAMVVIDGVTRLISGTLGHEDSAAQDSFSQGLLDCPHFTRPEAFEEKAVPSVLLSGDHQAIMRWREKQSLGKTWLRRRDLIEKLTLTPRQRTLLDEFKQESENDSWLAEADASCDEYKN